MDDGLGPHYSLTFRATERAVWAKSGDQAVSGQKKKVACWAVWAKDHRCP